MNPLFELRKQGQSIWLDYIRRDLIQNGELKQLIENDGLRGVRAIPAFSKRQSMTALSTTKHCGYCLRKNRT